MKSDKLLNTRLIPSRIISCILFEIPSSVSTVSFLKSRLFPYASSIQRPLSPGRAYLRWPMTFQSAFSSGTSVKIVHKLMEEKVFHFYGY